MQTLHLVSHTHWDREWYRPFQSFRLRLVHLIDHLLDILANDPEYMYFMLDGQTIVLDDYLAVRPERAEILAEHVRSGRLLIGPWHVLPDEFLVSPEATIRNLLKGGGTASRFGARMAVGYTPDPFGHIGQLPQILRGFGIQAACLQRGLSEEPVELWWDAPDGSRVFLAYLRDGYGNGSILSFKDLERAADQIARIRESLASHARTDQFLIMQGTDHMEPVERTPEGIRFANQRLEGARVVHSTLPAYLAAAQEVVERDQVSLPVISGELRSPRRHPLLPGVLSARIWIKQRNHACQVLLERWAEPFSTLASLVLAHLPPQPEEQLAWVERIDRPADLLQTAWNLLMECHPHDSICGCSVDQVHAEMLPRFDQVEQIAAEVTGQNLQILSTQIDTSAPMDGQPAHLAVIAFNPSAQPRTDSVDASFQVPDGFGSFAIVDETGTARPYQLVRREPAGETYLTYSRAEFLGMLWLLQSGEFPGGAVRLVSVSREGKSLQIHVTRYTSGPPNEPEIQGALAEITRFLEDPDLETFQIRVVTPASVEIRFVAREVPGIGYRTFWICPASEADKPVQDPKVEALENEFFRIQPDRKDGSLTVLDKRTGVLYTGLNRFVDGGDSGDEYNYNPPASDRLVAPQVTSIQMNGTAGIQTLEIRLEMDAPAALSADRQSRSAETTRQEIATRVTLMPGVPRIDVRTIVDNQANDHRLRVHFPAPFPVEFADYDGHFEVVRRRVRVEESDASWIEQPRPEKPQRQFTDISNGKSGLMIANRGLPEMEVSSPDGMPAELALTLLRCVGWLSRGDLRTRRGDAGPSLPTPGAQMPGRWTFDYSILPHPGGWQDAFNQAYAFNEPLQGITASMHHGPLRSTSSFVSIKPETFAVSAIKPAQERDGWILRGTNLLPDPALVELDIRLPFSSAYLCRIDETVLKQVMPDPDGQIRLTVRGHEILTLKFTGLGNNW